MAGRTLRVGLDVDGVILDGAEMKSRITKELFGLDIPPAVYSRKLVMQSGIVTPDQYEEMKEIAYNTDVAMTFRFIPGAIAQTQRMLDLGWEVLAITNRTEHATEYIRALFAQVGYCIPVHSNGGMDNPKIEIVRRLGGLDVYIDDDLVKLKPLQGHVSNLVLLDQPYNLEEDISTIGGWRANGWQHFVSQLQRKQSTLISARVIMVGS